MAMYTCQIGPTDTAPPCPGSPLRACDGTKGGTLWGRQPFCPISPLLLKCADGATTLSLCFGIDQDLEISGLDGELAAGCLRSGPAWIVFCFRCWVADGKNGEGDGEVRHWVLGGCSYGPPLPLPRYLHLAAHCQSDKSGHLVPSFCTFQHNRDRLGWGISSPISNTTSPILFSIPPMILHFDLVLLSWVSLGTDVFLLGTHSRQQGLGSVGGNPCFPWVSRYFSGGAAF